MPATLSIPFIAERRHGMAYSVWGIMLGFVLGALGVLIPGANFGLNVVFSLLMGVASGYLFAAVGPVLYGFIQTTTGSWNLLLWITVGLTLFMFGAGLIINAKHSIFAPQ